MSTTLFGNTGTNPVEEIVTVDHRDASESAEDHTKTWIDGFVESRSKDKEHRWSWVEAAAASWLSRREIEGKSEKALSAGSDQAEASASATPPNETDRPETPSA
jgi:hypothetical protein